MSSRSVLGSEALRALLDVSPNGIVAVDEDGLIVYANASALRRFDYPLEDLVGASVELLVPAGLRHEHVRMREGDWPASRGFGHLPDVNARRRDGSEFPAQVSLMPLDAPGGTLVLAVVADQTETRRTEERLTRLARGYRTLARMNEAMVRCRDAASLLQSTCSVAVDEGAFLGAWVAGTDPADPYRVTVVAESGVLAGRFADLRITLDPADPRSLGPTATTLREGRPVFIDDFLGDERTAPWRERAERSRVASAASLPLSVDGRTVAALVLYADQRGFFDAEMAALVEQVAANASVALESIRRAERLDQLLEQRTALLQRLVDVQRSERERIAAHLHDQPVQVLAALDLRLAAAHRRFVDASPDVAAVIDELRAGVARAGRDLRELMAGLEPMPAGSTLAQALQEAADAALSSSGTRWRVDDHSGRSRWGSITDEQALRIVKDALSNVREHAKATSVRVSLATEDGGLRVEVTDDGVGPGRDRDEASVVRPDGRGLRTMRERAEEVGGWLHVDAAEPAGTRVVFWLPRTDEGPRQGAEGAEGADEK